MCFKKENKGKQLCKGTKILKFYVEYCNHDKSVK